MTAVLTGPQTGNYTVTWWADAIGLTKNGFNLRRQYFEDEITADLLGDTPIDGVWRGTSMFVDFELLEYGDGRAANLALASSHDVAISGETGHWTAPEVLLDPYAISAVLGGSPTTDFLQGRLVHVGRLQSTIAQALVFSESIVGAQFPRTITFLESYIAPGVDYSTLFANRLRTLPISMKILPNNTANAFSFYVPDFLP